MIGDFTAGKTVRFNFNTFDGNGAPITLGGTPSLTVYKDSDTTPDTSGITLTEDLNSVVGLHNVAIDTSADGTFYSAGSDFTVVIAAGTVDGVSVVGATVGSFSLSNRAALRPTTADRTLDIQATGEADVNVTMNAGSAITSSSGRQEVNVSHWRGGAVPVTTQTGVPEVDLTYWRGFEPNYLEDGYVVANVQRWNNQSIDNMPANFFDLQVSAEGYISRVVLVDTTTQLTEDIDVTLSAEQVEDIIEAISAGFAVTAAHVDKDHTWKFDTPSQTTAPNFIHEIVGSDSVLVAMDFSEPMPAASSINSVISCTIADVSGATEPVVTSATMHTDKRRVIIDLDIENASAATYTVSVKIQTTDSQTFTRRGLLVLT